MSDDIVTRLREIADADMYRADISVSKLYEAADEIERLRDEVNVWRGVCERFAESDPRFDAFCFYFKAMRGE